MTSRRIARRIFLVSLLTLVALGSSTSAEAFQWPAKFFVPVVTDQGDVTESGTTLSATWTGPVLFEMFGGVASYEYEILRNGARGSVVVPWTSVGTDNGVTRQGLTLSPGTRYYFAVRAHHISGMTSGIGYSDGITFQPKVDTTPPTAPGQPTEGQPDQDVSTDGNYTVYWTASSDPESGIASYELWERVIGQRPDWHELVRVTDTKFAVTNRPRGQYYYAVFARNGAGLRSDWSPVSDGITVKPEPLQFIGLPQVDPTETSAVISWETNIASGGEVDYGPTSAYLQRMPDADPTPKTTHQVTLAELTPGTVYHFRVQSYNATDVIQTGDGTFETRPNVSIPPPGAKNFGVEGATVVSWWFDEYATRDADQELRNLAATGADWIGLLMTWYMDSQTGSRIFQHALKSPTDDALIHAIREAKKLGRKVSLKLHVNVIVNDAPRGNWQDTWAGQIQPANRQAWFDSYVAYAQHYAALAQAEGVDLFGFGTELPTMTTSAAPDGALNVQGWNRVISAVRQRYTGKLTYSAHSSEFLRVPFWASCDYLGLDAYPSLTPPNVQRPGLDQLINGWWKNTVDAADERIDVPTLAQWSKDNGNKPVLFTEVGYRSIGDCGFQPWDAGRGVFDEACQKSAYDAAFLALQKQPWFAGMFWWNWVPRSETYIRSADWTWRGYTPQYKVVSQSLTNFYLGVDSSKIASIEIVDQTGKPLPDVLEVASAQPINLYAVAKDAAGKTLGFAPSTWVKSNFFFRREQDIIDVVSNDVGLARVTMTAAPGTLYDLIVQEPSTKRSDAITLKVASAPPPPPQGCPPGAVCLYVPSQYKTIQEAANAARAGETILVAPAPDTYKESVSLPPGVSLVSQAGPLATIIDATGKPFGVRGGALVQGFTIRNADGPGIPRGAPQRIINNIIEGNRGGGYEGGGIDIYGQENMVIANNVIRNNTTQEFGGGIRLDGNTEAIIVNNVIINNESLGTNSQGGGIYISSSSKVVVRNNILMGNKAQIGPAVRTWAGGDFATFEFNDFWDHGPYPIVGGSASNPDPSANAGIKEDPKFVNAALGDYHLQRGSPCINAGNPDAKYNDKDGSRNDMGIYGGPQQFP